MDQSSSAHEGADFLRNWAAQLLCEKGHKIGAPKIFGDGIMRTPVDDDLCLTNEELIAKASAYPEWRGRKRLFLEHLNEYQALLASS